MNVLHLDTGRTWRGGQAQVLALMRGLRGSGTRACCSHPPAPCSLAPLPMASRRGSGASCGDLDLRAVPARAA